MLSSGRLMAGALAVGLASGTRVSALPFVVAVAWVAIEQYRQQPRVREAVRAVGAVVLSVSGFAAFQLYLWAHTGEATAWFRVEREGFDEGASPSRRTWEILDFFVDQPRDVPHLLTAVVVIIALALVALVVVSRVLPIWMKVPSVLVIVGALTAAVAPASPRLQLLALPAFVAAAERVRDTTLTVVVAISAVLLFALTVGYGSPGEAPFLLWAP